MEREREREAALVCSGVAFLLWLHLSVSTFCLPVQTSSLPGPDASPGQRLLRGAPHSSSCFVLLLEQLED